MNYGVIFAGGVGSRMNNTAMPKQFLEVQGKPIIIRTVEHFENHVDIDGIVLVCVEGWIDYLKDLLVKYSINKVIKIVEGGTTGQMSIFNGLNALAEFRDDDAIVLIHDGVRPLIDSDLISRNIESVKNHGNGITCSDVHETVMEVSDNHQVLKVHNRSTTKVAKAPQSFWLNEILDIQDKAISEGKINFVDSSSLMQYYGYKMFTVNGSSDNIKITTPSDYFTLEAILTDIENSKIYGK